MTPEEARNALQNPQTPDHIAQEARAVLHPIVTAEAADAVAEARATAEKQAKAQAEADAAEAAAVAAEEAARATQARPDPKGSRR